MYYEVYVYMHNRYPSYALLGGDFHPSQQGWDVNLRYGTHEFSNPHPESVKGIKNINSHLDPFLAFQSLWDDFLLFPVASHG